MGNKQEVIRKEDFDKLYIVHFYTIYFKYKHFCRYEVILKNLAKR